MKSRYNRPLAAALFGMIVISCHKSSNGPKSCVFGLTDGEALSTNEEVIYLAGVSDAGSTITSVSYLDSAGTTTVMNPTLPWTKTVNLKAGVKASISAKGTADKGGQINISFVVSGVQSGTSCSN